MIKNNSELIWEDAPKAASQAELGQKKPGLHKTIYEKVRVVRKSVSPLSNPAIRIANLRSRSTVSVGEANTEVKQKHRPMTRKERLALEAVEKEMKERARILRLMKS